MRAYHFLGDNPSDRSLIFSLAKGDVLTALVAYTKDYTLTGTTVNSPTYAWKAGSYTVTGATLTLLSVATLVGLVSSLF